MDRKDYSSDEKNFLSAKPLPTELYLKFNKLSETSYG